MEDSEKCPHHFHYRRGYGHGARSGGTEVTEVAAAGKWHVFDGRACKKFLGLFPSEKHMVRVIDRNGVVTLQREGVGVIVTNKVNMKEDLGTLFEETAAYGTVGEELPLMFAYYGEKQLDLSGLTAQEQRLCWETGV